MARTSSRKKSTTTLNDTLAIKKQIVDRVAPAPKPNPNLPKRKHSYKEGSPGFNRAATPNFTLTAIRKSINEPLVLVTLHHDEEGQPTGESSTLVVKPSLAVKEERRDSFVKLGVLGPFASHNERRKTRRRNGRYAACNKKKA